MNHEREQQRDQCAFGILASWYDRAHEITGLKPTDTLRRNGGAPAHIISEILCRGNLVVGLL
jgi:hypothetical protein